VSILLEELGVEYDAHPISISKGDQFNSGFVQLNPNSKIPAIRDLDGPEGKPIDVFESASIMIYLADKFKKFLPTDPRLRTEAMTWIFWQMSAQGPMTGQFGHFFVYAPDDQIDTRNYGVGRYGMEVQRLCSVLDTHLQGKKYVVGEEYTIADMILLPWYNILRTGYQNKYGIMPNEFLTISQYKNANAWADRLLERPGVQRGLQVLKGGIPKPWLQEHKS